MNRITELKIPEKIDLYRNGLGMVAKKIAWDVSLAGIRSRQRLTQLRNTHQNERAVILCNGPSLNKVDFELLKDSNVFTIGLNKINLLFDRTDFRPNLIVSVNKLVIDQNADFYNQTSINLILDSYGASLVKQKPNVSFIYSAPFQLRFARDVRGAVCQGYTVTYAALQIAYHLGFRKVALVGCDHSFATKGSPNQTVTSKDKDPNHFAPNYFSGGEKWQLPDLLGSEIHYKLAREYYEADNREIVNCTDGGELEIFNRSELSRFLNE